ncbi:AhpC/TSA antioxidant enzyme-domain-containing protein [Lactifluus subvellereus]|nr:AhpC/TSA antioxidant enzyme-domain-containing protein [Lactifluus subvellereus]
MCQDYLASLMRDVDHAALARSGVRLVVIGCGSYGLIRSYRQIFHLPYELFVDASPGQALYRALGMGHVPSGSQKARSTTAENGVGSYVRHGAVSGLAMVVAHALRVGMPVWERGGDASQLGGEFVLGPGPSCTYAHRMQSTAGHAPIVDVISAAGVRVARKDAGAGLGLGSGSGLRVLAGSASGSVRTNISLPLERGGGGRDAKVLSVGCAEALNIDLESTASGEWSVVLTGNGLCPH